MSGDGLAVEGSESNPIGRGQRSLLDELKAQAGPMLGMAGMLVITILLAIKIQPF